MNAKLRGGADRARALTLFTAVVEHGSLSAAGRVLGMSPSAVSRAMDRIEERLGVRLLLRSTRTLSLTAEGQAYLQAAHRILADLDSAEQEIADQGAPRGRLRISAALSHGRLCVVPMLDRFVARYPHIRLDISLTDALVDVAAGDADVAIRVGALASSSLTARKIGSTRRVVVASPDYLRRHGTPEIPEDLRDHNCLNFTFRADRPQWPFRHGGRDYALPVSGNVDANNGDTVAQLAALGLGIARVGAFAVAAEIAQGRLVPILEAFNPGDIEDFHAVLAGGASTPARVRVFVDFLGNALM
jgi:DNA-binding transcriptional LysR family regulator